MVLSRNQFFLVLIGISILPLFAYKLIWLATTKQASGIVYFIGHGNLGSALGISTYPVIQFRAGRDTVEFNGNINLDIRPGDPVPVRYQKNDPSDAKINTLICIWGDTLAYAFFPFLVLLIIYFIPDRFDPVIPRKSKVRIGKRPFIKLLMDNG